MCEFCTPLPPGRKEDRSTNTVDDAAAYQRDLFIDDQPTRAELEAEYGHDD